jgi:tetratricopeptide (TPR) repeat protein
MVDNMRLPLSTTVAVLLLPSASIAADTWHLADWNARAVVEIARVSTEPGCDVCGVKVLCQGRAKADGSDYRVVDAEGKALPFQLYFHDAGRYSLVSFKCDNAKGKYFIYFDNPKASRAAEQVMEDPAPGAGPPKGAWIPKFGFVLQTIMRPEGDNPRKVDEMAKLIAGSKAKYGARYQRRVSEGYNHFGPSDYYISIYRGWVRVPKPGKYQFCTVSNEASFSFLDGKELIHWPGHHTVDRGMRGEVNTLVELSAGLHYLEYYHEEVTLEQMAFLGWRSSADDGPFSPIPESFYTMPHAGAVKAYEGPKGPLVTFEPIISDSVWPTDRSEGQYTRAVFQPGIVLPPGTTYEWDFGDGQRASGVKVEHLFLTLGKHSVTLTATRGKETLTARWPLLVFEIEHVTDQFKEGRPKNYVKLVKGYYRGKLNAEALKEMAYLLAESEDASGALAVGKEYVARYAENGEPLQVARVRRLMADCAIRLGEGSLDEAIKNYQASLVKVVPAKEKIEVLGRLIRLLGIDRNQPERVPGILKQVEKIAKTEKLDVDGRRFHRKAVNAAGDVFLWNNKGGDAQKLYAQAEKLLPRPIPAQVRAARIGAYPNSLREYIASENYGAALGLVDQWDDLFPTDKLNGQTFYWRGKVLALRGQPREAVRYLDRAVRIATGAAFETEARWLLAEGLEQIGKKEAARGELAKLLATGLSDEYTKKARAKLLSK